VSSTPLESLVPYSCLHPADPGRPPHVSVGCPRPGLMAPSSTWLRDPLTGASQPLEGRRSWWPSAVASADGFCGLLASGHLSSRDPWGYRGHRFRPSGVLLPVSLRLERYVAAPRTPTGARRVPASDLALGNSVGAIRMVSGALQVRLRCPVPGPGASHPFRDIPSPSPVPGAAGLPSGRPR
jgi:hypothetical protein